MKLLSHEMYLNPRSKNLTS